MQQPDPPRGASAPETGAGDGAHRTGRGRAPIEFLDAGGRRTDTFTETQVVASSDGLNWPGLTVLAGRNRHWVADELTTDRHYLAVNVAPMPLAWEAKVDGRFTTVGVAPGGMWFCPAGERFTHRVSAPSEFVLVTIDPQRFAAWTGERRFALARRYALVSAQLEHLSRALAAEAERGGPNGTLFVDALGTAIANGVGALMGAAPPEAPGALAAARLRRVLDYMEANLGRDLSVEELAREAHYSPAHFARAFKAATGESPHRYLLARRLERARLAVQRGEALAELALALGFTDQSHFTKAFKGRFGVTPGVMQGRWGFTSTKCTASEEGRR